MNANKELSLRYTCKWKNIRKNSTHSTLPLKGKINAHTPCVTEQFWEKYILKWQSAILSRQENQDSEKENYFLPLSLIIVFKFLKMYSLP